MSRDPEPKGPASGAPAQATAAPRLDVEALHAALDVHREIELPRLLRVLLERLVEWSGASFAIGLGVGETTRDFVPLASSAPAADDPCVTAFSGVAPDRLKHWLPDGPAVQQGWGPFAALVEARWPAAPPQWLAALPLAAPPGRWAGVLLLLYEARPKEALLRRMIDLVEASRPAAANALRVLAMRELIIKDDTARCFNRRHFEESLPEELSRASRFRTPLSLIFLDMDNLKQVNSLHGHSVGSRTLFEVSVRVRSKIRKFDKLFRFGGDEFCIVLPETEWHGAMEVADRVRDAISRRNFLAGEIAEGQGVAMSASFGIAAFPLHARTHRQLVQQADRAMQKVKRQGKNGIGVAEAAGEPDDE